jgi:hypothetical protein
MKIIFHVVVFVSRAKLVVVDLKETLFLSFRVLSVDIQFLRFF